MIRIGEENIWILNYKSHLFAIKPFESLHVKTIVEILLIMPILVSNRFMYNNWKQFTNSSGVIIAE